MSTEPPLAPQRILVTGGCGFIGSALVRHLVGDRHARVLNIDKLTYAGDPATVASLDGDARYSFLHADICDEAALQRAFAEFAPDAVVHLAAESHVDRSLDAPSAFIDTNVVGTFRLLEAALRHWERLGADAKAAFRMLHVSTDEVYGSLPLDEGVRFDEQTRYAPNSPYAASKAAADHLARAWSRSYGLPVIITNCSNNYGPFQFPDKLIPRMILAALAGEPLPVYGAGANVRDWLFVEDHARALAEILTRGVAGRTYLIGGRSERSNLALVRLICGILDDCAPSPDGRPHDARISFVPDRPGHDLRYAVDDRRLRAELGWAPRETLESGLRRTVAWYLDNADWWRGMSARYAGGRLGLARAPAAAPAVASVENA